MALCHDRRYRPGVSFLLALAAAAACIVIDGDTLRCGDERIRLTGIDAPELRSCRPRGRRCVDGDGEAARRALTASIAGHDLRIVRLGRDRYGRTLAVVYAGSTNLACAQMASGNAAYRRDWDARAMVARDCPVLTRTRLASPASQG